MLVGRKNHGVLTGVGDDRIGRAMVQGKGVVNSISGNRVNPRVHEGKFDLEFALVDSRIYPVSTYGINNSFSLYHRSSNSVISHTSQYPMVFPSNQHDSKNSFAKDTCRLIRSWPSRLDHIELDEIRPGKSL